MNFAKGLIKKVDVNKKQIIKKEKEMSILDQTKKTENEIKNILQKLKNNYETEIKRNKDDMPKMIVL